MKAIIIGNHAAGLSAAETLRKGDLSCEITVISQEDIPPYSRCLIPYLVSGEKQIDDILFKPKDFYKRNSIRTMFGQSATKIFTKEKHVLLANDKKVEYDALIIATGGTPSLPNIPGIQNKGVFGFRTLQDAKEIISYCNNVDTAIVLGGGLIGLKAAIALHKRGKKVKVIVTSPNILSQIVSSEEAKIFENYFTKQGIEIMTKTSPVKVLGKEKVEGIEIAEGKDIRCQMVVVGKGVRAHKELAEGNDIKTEYGIIVDEHCRTNVLDVYAAGDVTQSPDSVRKEKFMNALWPHAVEEGRVAAENILGKKTILKGRTSMNSIKVDDLALISCGLTGAREKVEGGEETTVKGPREMDYKRFVLKDNCLVGFSLVGNVAHAGILTSLIIKEINVEKIKDQFISGKYDFPSMLPLIRENKEKFNEPEYEEVFLFF